MLEALANAFSSPWWIAGVLLYGLIGLVLVRPTGGARSTLMTALGWPMELTQRLAGATGLPYLFLLPNMLVFGLFTFAPLFVSGGFAFTDGASINFDQREFSGLDNAARLLRPVNIDTGLANPQASEFRGAVADTVLFSLIQVPVMVLIALATALVLNRPIVGRAFWRSIFFYPVMLSPVVVGFLWALVLDRQGSCRKRSWPGAGSRRRSNGCRRVTGPCFGPSLSTPGPTWGSTC